MSNTGTLERVISEQQKEIDYLKLIDRMNREQWLREHKRQERFMDSFWLFFNNPSDKQAHWAVRMLLAEQGWCVRCQQNPCGCDDE
jgi:transposase-like protein